MGLPTMPVQNAEIAAMFDQAAELLEIQGENQFRVRAYRRAARVIEGLPQSVRGLLSAGRDLSDLPGIGKDLAGKIADIVKTGHFPLLDTLKKKLPGDLGDMAALPGLGPKRVKLLYDKLKVRTLDDLRHVLKTGRLRELKGFGPIIARKLSDALEKPRAEKRFKLSVAEAEADALVGFLRDGGHIVVAGSYRRRRDTVGDLDVLVTAQDGAAVGDKLVRYENIAEVLAHGPTRTTVMLRSGLQVDVRAVPEQSYGAALLYFTGSKAHNIALRGLAIEHGWKLNEYGEPRRMHLFELRLSGRSTRSCWGGAVSGPFHSPRSSRELIYATLHRLHPCTQLKRTQPPSARAGQGGACCRPGSSTRS
jgi:DNA polymerase (family 10)